MVSKSECNNLGMLLSQPFEAIYAVSLAVTHTHAHTHINVIRDSSTLDLRTQLENTIILDGDEKTQQRSSC